MAMDATPAELAELKSVFKAECEEHLTALDSLLLKLEQAPQNTLVLQETFRRVHSIKGAARMVGYAGLESVAHAMETMLAGARDGRQTSHGNADFCAFRRRGCHERSHSDRYRPR